MKRIILALFLCSVHVNTAYASWFGPDNYEDCILEGIPTAKTDMAVRLVRSTCRDKFPSKKKANNKNPRTHLDVLGDYVCEQITGGNSILEMFIDEKAKSLRDGRRAVKIIRSTDEALFSAKYGANNGDTAYWKIYRLGRNYLATHDSLRVQKIVSKGYPHTFACKRSM